MLNRFSIASYSIEVTLLWTPLDSSIQRKFKSRHLSIHQASYFSIYSVNTISFISHRYLSILSASSPPQTHFSHSKPLPHTFFGLDCSSFTGKILFSLFFHAFHSYKSRFSLFIIIIIIIIIINNLGFFKIDEVFAKFLGWVLFK